MNPAIVSALRAGRIDAVSFAWPLSMIAENEGVGKALIAPALGDVPAMAGELQGAIYVRDDTIAKREDALIAFLRAIGRAETLIHREGARGRTLLKQYDAQMSDPAIDKLFPVYLPVLPEVPRITPANYEKALAFHRITGYAGPTGNAYADVVATATLDKAFR